MKLNFYLATKNKNKVYEAKEILKGTGISVIPSPSDVIFPEETGKTFEENALMKARHLKYTLGDVNVVGEDSGLVVKMINGLPGVLSARFAGDDCNDRKNIKKLLGLLAGFRNIEDRKAEFVTVVALVSSQEEKTFVGSVEGFITFSPRGKNGFGYDPIFEIPGTGKTFAELSITEKNRFSHRAIAFRKFADYMLKRYNK
jgi:XTP/dITP diphosphohydrolase